MAWPCKVAGLDLFRCATFPRMRIGPATKRFLCPFRTSCKRAVTGVPGVRTLPAIARVTFECDRVGAASAEAGRPLAASEYPYVPFLSLHQKRCLTPKLCRADRDGVSLVWLRDREGTGCA